MRKRTEAGVMMQPSSIQAVKAWAAVHGLPIYNGGQDIYPYARRSDRAAYTASRYLGWGADVYLFKGMLVVAGYRPFGEDIPRDALLSKIKRAGLVRFK